MSDTMMTDKEDTSTTPSSAQLQQQESFSKRRPSWPMNNATHPGGAFRRPRKSALKVATQSASLQSSWESSSHAPKYVTWEDVHIRQYERTVGDNPSCSSGAPLRWVGCWVWTCRECSWGFMRSRHAKLFPHSICFWSSRSINFVFLALVGNTIQQSTKCPLMVTKLYDRLESPNSKWCFPGRNGKKFWSTNGNFLKSALRMRYGTTFVPRISVAGR